MQKTNPVLFNREEECCGCSACLSICPNGAIEMKENAEGFLYPIIDYNKCLRCFKCIKVCPFKQNK